MAAGASVPDELGDGDVCALQLASRNVAARAVADTERLTRDTVAVQRKLFDHSSGDTPGRALTRAQPLKLAEVLADIDLAGVRWCCYLDEPVANFEAAEEQGRDPSAGSASGPIGQSANISCRTPIEVLARPTVAIWPAVSTSPPSHPARFTAAHREEYGGTDMAGYQ